MKQSLSVFLGKATYNIGKHFTNCSAIPGKIALNINKNVLKDIKKDKNTIIFITGTNGKTSTTFYSYNSIKNYATNVVTNLSGANMLQGVITEILKYTKKNRFEDKICVFEVDELTLPLLIKNDLVPDYVVITNLFDDQVDRYGSKEILAKTLRESLEKTNAKLIVNFENPTLRIITDKIKNEVVYFGVEGYSKEIIVKNNLEYKYINYGDVGFFKNSQDNEFKDLRNFILKETELGCTVVEEEIEISHKIANKEKFDIIYNKYNYIASYSLFKTLVNDKILKYDDKDILEFMTALDVGNGRMESFTFLNAPTKLNLVKNPIGLELSLDEYAKEKEKFDLVLGLNNTPADGTDMSWIKTVDFKKFIDNSSVDKIYITGNAYELANNFLKENILENNLTNILFIQKSNLKSVLTQKTLFLACFSELQEMRNFIVSNKNN